ncbi:MAG: urease accessory protein UreD [Cyanobacteria bacterium HKST-UBA02]|nr:urease accessory protein UreD [Cyanobacteria bacterium HKST-UBA02]
MLNHGIARLRTDFRPLENRSVVSYQFGKAPLQVHRPLYLNRSCHPTIFLRSPSAGLLDGDIHEIEIDVADGATLEVRTQAACLVYTGASRQEVLIKLGHGSKLCFCPQPFILTGGASFTQRLKVDMHESSGLLLKESWSAGRIAMGECWQFEQMDSSIQIDISGKMAYRDRWHLSPGAEPADDALVAGSYNAYESLYLFGKAWSECPDVPEDGGRLTLHSEDGTTGNSTSWSMDRGDNRVRRMLERC